MILNCITCWAIHHGSVTRSTKKMLEEVVLGRSGFLAGRRAGLSPVSVYHQGHKPSMAKTGLGRVRGSGRMAGVHMVAYQRGQTTWVFLRVETKVEKELFIRDSGKR